MPSDEDLGRGSVFFVVLDPVDLCSRGLFFTGPRLPQLPQATRLQFNTIGWEADDEIVLSLVSKGKETLIGPLPAAHHTYETCASLAFRAHVVADNQREYGVSTL